MGMEKRTPAARTRVSNTALSRTRVRAATVGSVTKPTVVESPAKEPRKYALTKQSAGVYLCPSNDGATLYRFSRYEDGSYHGLVVDYERRMFWKVERTEIRDGGYVDLEYADWVEAACWLPTRRAALAEVFAP